MDCGADRAITQFFFDNDLYFRYLDRVRARGITIPIVPGILPVQNFKLARSFAEKAGASMPDWLLEQIAARAGRDLPVADRDVAGDLTAALEELARDPPAAAQVETRRRDGHAPE